VVLLYYGFTIPSQRGNILSKGLPTIQIIRQPHELIETLKELYLKKLIIRYGL